VQKAFATEVAPTGDALHRLVFSCTVVMRFSLPLWERLQPRSSSGKLVQKLSRLKSLPQVMRRIGWLSAAP
jgi:hypothetical protein